MRLLTLLFLPLLLTPAGGRIAWIEVKDAKHWDEIKEDCKKKRHSLMAYYRSGESNDCKKLEAGDFSDARVIEAAQQLVTVVLDSKRNADLFKKHNVTKPPTVDFFGPDHQEYGTLIWGDVAATLDQINGCADEAPHAVPWAEDSKAGLDQAKKEGKLVLVLFRNDGDASKLAERVLGNLAIVEMHPKFVWIRQAIELKSKEAKELGLTAVPCMWVLNGGSDDPVSKPVRKIALPKTGADLKTEIDTAVKAMTPKAK